MERAWCFFEKENIWNLALLQSLAFVSFGKTNWGHAILCICVTNNLGLFHMLSLKMFGFQCHLIEEFASP